MSIEVLKSCMQYLDNLSEQLYQQGELDQVDIVDKCWQRILRMKERAEQRAAFHKYCDWVK